MLNLNTARVVLLAFIIVLIAEPAIGSGEGIATNKEGNYIISYWGEDQDGNQAWRQIVFVPGNKVDVDLKSKVGILNESTISYRYKVKAKKDSSQALARLTLPAVNITTDLLRLRGWDVSNPGWDMNVSPSDIEQLDLKGLDGALVTPSGWRGTANPNFGGTGFRVSWSYIQQNAEGGLQPSTSQNNIGFESTYLPGAGIMRFSGAIPVFQGYPDNGPNQPLYDQILELLAPDSDYQSVPRLAAVPHIPVPAPFDAVVVLGGIKSHLDQDLVVMKLVEPALVAELDRWLEAAIAAAKSGNTAALKSDLKEARKILKREREDVDTDDDGDRDGDDKEKKIKPRIDKLAARVLDFDLKYIEKRVKGDKG